VAFSFFGARREHAAPGTPSSAYDVDMRSVSHALAAILTLGPVLWLISIYPQLPERLPAHWNIHGQVDRWAQKNVFSVFLLAAISVEVQLLLGLLVYDTCTARERATSPAMRHSLSVMVQMLQPIRFAIVVLFGIVIAGFGHGGSAASFWFGPAVLACVAFLVLVSTTGAYRSWKAQQAYETSAGADAPEFQGENYRWGLYYNPADPNFLVHKRIGIGFTINAAHRRALLYLLLFVTLMGSAIASAVLF
jgi:uncharacterized membrane protein